MSYNLLPGGKLNSFNFVISSGFFLYPFHNICTPIDVMLYLYHTVLFT